MKTKNQPGISAVVVLGVIAVLLTIVVPLISRTVIDLRISRQQEEQARAFSVAETGLERALIGDLTGQTIDGIQYTVSQETLGGAENGDEYVYPKSIDQNTPATIWLVSHQANGEDFDPNAAWNESLVPIFTGNEMTVYWGESKTYQDEGEYPALEATLVYKDGADYKVSRWLFDPVSGRSETGASAAPDFGGTLWDGEDAVDFEWSAVISGMDCDNVTCYLLRLRVLYAPGDVHPVGLSYDSDFYDLPRQGECYNSLASVLDSGISSRVERCLLYRDYPPVFDFAMYSGGGLIKE